MKKLVLILLFIMLISPVLGKEMLSHDAVIEIDKEGNAVVTERFVMSLEDGFETERFADLSQLKTTDVSVWNNFYNRFPNIK